MAAEIINLRSVKKARKRAEARAQADANVAKFGRSKADKRAEDAAKAKAKQVLDGHAIEGDASDPKDAP
ncbi:DUF4169 family protein [Pseudorhodobacter sp.]|uniref:DUF4169 family protein n=1 Tax=Pseudorhodobacter sp. TaxID=1934400 RepID=UPI002648140C|nr:DUF4169 family protein [Pseudorhodobacter sp.]MDN5787897.1 DUF4169 family protein [Pseudorhodobacter sp.]